MRHLVIGVLVSRGRCAGVHLDPLQRARAAVARGLVERAEIEARHRVLHVRVERAEVADGGRFGRERQHVVPVGEILIEEPCGAHQIEAVHAACNSRVLERGDDEVDDVARVLHLIVDADHRRQRNAREPRAHVDIALRRAARHLERAPVDERLIEAVPARGEHLIDLRGGPRRLEEADDLSADGPRRDARPRLDDAVRRVARDAAERDRGEVADDAEVAQRERARCAGEDERRVLIEHERLAACEAGRERVGAQAAVQLPPRRGAADLHRLQARVGAQQQGRSGGLAGQHSGSQHGQHCRNRPDGRTRFHACFSGGSTR